MYINDFYNVIEIDSIIEQVIREKRIYDVKDLQDLIIVVPCLYHRNDKRYNSDFMPELFDKVKYLEFPYETSYKFKDYPEIKVTVYDDFPDKVEDKNDKKQIEEVLKSYKKTTCESSGSKFIFQSYYKFVIYSKYNKK